MEKTPKTQTKLEKQTKLIFTAKAVIIFVEKEGIEDDRARFSLESPGRNH